MDPTTKKHQTKAADRQELPTDYELLDFGQGRRLERFGTYFVDRPCPPANSTPPSLALWPTERLHFTRQTAQQGSWRGSLPAAGSWTAKLGGISFCLKTTPSGQIGLFAEQLSNWTWIRQQLQQPSPAPRLKILNLFAYTGGSTLAAAMAGAEVTHVDAAESIVTWGRENLQLAQLSPTAVRWIVDDARKFVAREQRRGRRYDGVILDPPTYGHGAKGEAWRLERDLPELIELCRAVLGDQPRLFLLTCHPPAGTPEGLFDRVRSWVGELPLDWSVGELALRDRAGRVLPSGLYLRGAMVPNPKAQRARLTR